jgi:FkbM family methyltransferase
MARRSLARARLREVFQSGLGYVVTRPAGLKVVNGIHRRLTPTQKRRFFYATFDAGYLVHGDWIVDFAGRPIVLPLRRDFSLSWAAAVAFHGFDPEVHAFYEEVIMTGRRPRVFFDIGACYGLHSLRFLVHGVRAVLFEPNATCHAWFRECCQRNGVRPEIHAVACADRPGTAQLAVPDDAPWDATIMRDVKHRWSERRTVRVLTVPQMALDAFIAEHGVQPDLMKIDTEGSERLVLSGATRLLASAAPLVVFESWPDSADRPGLYALLEAAGYRIDPLTWPPRPGRPLSRIEFREASGINFVARPQARSSIYRRPSGGMV